MNSLNQSDDRSTVLYFSYYEKYDSESESIALGLLRSCPFPWSDTGASPLSISFHRPFTSKTLSGKVGLPPTIPYYIFIVYDINDLCLEKIFKLVKFRNNIGTN
jgi:hypothetical protein